MYKFKILNSPGTWLTTVQFF